MSMSNMLSPSVADHVNKFYEKELKSRRYTKLEETGKFYYRISSNLLLAKLKKKSKIYESRKEVSQEEDGSQEEDLIQRNPPSSERTTPVATAKVKGLKNRWSIQDELAKIFNVSLKYALDRISEGVSCSIYRCPKKDGDYICTNVTETWPELRKTSSDEGPSYVALEARAIILDVDTTGIIERCVVCGPGFLMFKLSMKCITKGIHMMVKHGMDICAPKLSVKRAMVYFSSPNIAEETHTNHLRSVFIGETLARILEYARVEVIRKCDEKHDFEGNEFAWAIISKEIRERNKQVYELQNLIGKGFEPFGSNFLESLSKFKSEGTETGILVELREFSSAALRHALNVVKADWILNVTDVVGQRDHIEMCINDAKRAGWIVNDRFPLSHVGFGLVQAYDYGRLLDEAKIRCKTVLVGQAKADKWTAEELEDTAKALGYGAVKYAVLKNNRLTKCRINLDEILNKKGNTVVYLHYTHAQVCSVITEYTGVIEKLKKLKGKKVEKFTLKNNEERELGLHLLRFTEVLGEVCKLLMPHILCEYLYELCKKFDSFYSCMSQVVGYGDERSNIMLCEATEQVMRKCFHLLAITPIGSKLSKRFYFSDLTEQQLMELFSNGPCLRFDMCKVVFGHNIDDAFDDRSVYNNLVLFGIIQAENHLSDPSHGSFNILNRNIDNPLVLTKPGSLSPPDICYYSISVSTFVKITAKLYATTYMGDGIENAIEYGAYFCKSDDEDEDEDEDEDVEAFFRKIGGEDKDPENGKVHRDDDALEICDGNMFINLSEHFASRPNGGSGYSRLKGKDGYLDLYYVALKYAVEASLEVDFVASSKESKVFGSVMAYYGKNFSYDASEKDLYKQVLFEMKQPSHIKHGNIYLTRSSLDVPAQFSLIIEAKLQDYTSGDMILSGVFEFFVPVDGRSSVGFISGNGCSLKLRVDWKLPI